MKYAAFKIEEKDGKPVRTSGGIVYTRKYDEKGNRMEMVVYDVSGKIINKITGKYDERGNRVKETTFRAETANDETRFVPTEEITLEFTYWN